MAPATATDRHPPRPMPAPRSHARSPLPTPTPPVAAQGMLFVFAGDPAESRRQSPARLRRAGGRGRKLWEACRTPSRDLPYDALTLPGERAPIVQSMCRFTHHAPSAKRDTAAP